MGRIVQRVLRPLARIGVAVALGAACWGAHAADPGKVLRVAQSDIDTLDPQQWTDFYSFWVGVAIFEGLYEWDYLARPVRLSPNTAVDLPSVSADGLTWTIRVKPGIEFTDDPAFGGKRRELTADDYVYSFKRRLDPNLRPGGAAVLIDTLLGARAAVERARKAGKAFDYDTPLDGVHALDRYTLQLRLTQPNYPVIQQYLTDTLAVAREVVEAAGRDIDTRAIGTGPYVLKEWQRGSRILLEANRKYRPLAFPKSNDPADAAIVRAMEGKSLPQIGVVDIRIVPEMQSRLLEFVQGGLDYVQLEGDIATRMLERNGKLKAEYANAGMRHFRLPQTYARYTYFNLSDPLVGGMGVRHVSLRRAIALAFDSRELAEVAYAGQAVPLGQIVPPTVTTHDGSLPGAMPFSATQARALLDRAGYDKRDAENYRLTPDGKPLLLTITTRTGALWREWETLWAKNLNAIGVRVRFRELSTQDQLKEMDVGHFQMAIRGFGGTPLGYRNLAQLVGTQTPVVNPSRFRMPEYDDLYDRMLREPDIQRQTVLSRQMSEIARIYVPLIPHVVEVENAFVQPWVSGYQPCDFSSYWKYLDIDVAARGNRTTGVARR